MDQRGRLRVFKDEKIKFKTTPDGKETYVSYRSFSLFDLRSVNVPKACKAGIGRASLLFPSPAQQAEQPRQGAKNFLSKPRCIGSDDKNFSGGNP
ncbi:hypothetical protein D9C10_22705 (plasmid) [Bacillus subtilis subsp. subtilis]|nr:hypothetical protein C0W65_22165 [Bacillus subtilis]AYK59846.1 hypothetical protein D9C10_22705 [Bacillus subtilis subsp. subtilis]